MSEAHQKTGQANQTTHYGWDGDRLIHTESKEHIHHTVYEPGSFVPLLQLQRKKAGQTNLVKTLGGTAGADSPEQDLPRHEWEMLHQALKEVRLHQAAKSAIESIDN